MLYSHFPSNDWYHLSMERCRTDLLMVIDSCTIMVKFTIPIRISRLGSESRSLLISFTASINAAFLVWLLVPAVNSLILADLSRTKRYRLDWFPFSRPHWHLDRHCKGLLHLQDVDQMLCCLAEQVLPFWCTPVIIQVTVFKIPFISPKLNGLSWNVSIFFACSWSIISSIVVISPVRSPFV